MGMAKVTGALFKKAVSGDTQSMMFYLRNRDPENWNVQNRIAVAINLELKKISEMTDQELADELQINNEEAQANKDLGIVRLDDLTREELSDALDRLTEKETVDRVKRSICQLEFIE